LANNATFDVSALSIFNLSTGPTNQTLGGNGNILGNVGMSNTATLQPGTSSSVGTLAISGNLSLLSSSTLSYAMNTATTVGSGINDLITVGGNLDPQNAKIFITAMTALTPGSSYRLLNYSGSKLSTFNPAVSTDTH
jgi:hypothetical protein